MRFFGKLFTKKIAIAIFATSLCLLAVGPVLVAQAAPAYTDNGLDWQWPTVPGVGSLAQKSDAVIIRGCQQLHPDDFDKQRVCVSDEKGKQLGQVVRYFLYLFFYLITGACVILIVLAGASYVTSSKNVQKLIDAKARLRNASLGILIVASSWALLYIINPNLLLFQTKIPDIPPIPVIEGEKNGSNVTFASFSVKEMIDYVIASSTAENPATGEMAILSPYRRAQNTINEAVRILQGDPAFENKTPPRPGLKNLLAFCQCGTLSKTHLERKGPVDFVIKPGGMDYAEMQTYLAGITNPTAQDLCLTRCNNCGTFPGQPPPQDDGYTEVRNCWLNNVLTVSVKGDGITPIKCPRPVKASDYSDLWTYGEYYAPNHKDTDTIPAMAQLPDASWEKCEFVYYDKYPNITKNKPWTDWAVLAVFYPESSGQKWIEFTTAITNDAMNDRRLAYSIKYQIVRLFKIVPQLEAIKLELASDQIEKLGKVLASNAMDYLLFEGKGGIFQPEIDDEKRMLASRGYEMRTQEFMGNEEIPGLNTPAAAAPSPTALGKTFWGKFKIFAALGDFIKPFRRVFAAQPVFNEEIKEPSDDRFYVVTNVETFGANISPYDQQMVDQNKLVIREASRANLFSVLADQTLEEIEKMTGDCMASAFGEAKYDLPANINEVISSAIGQGTADYLVDQLTKNSDKLAGMIGQEVADQVSQKAEGTLQKRCANKCNMGTPLLSDEAMEAYLSDPANKQCVEKCEKENIPANFVSNKIGQFLSQPIALRLPGEIGKDLNSKLKEVLKDSDAVSALDDKMIDLYSKVLHVGLSKSFAEQIPALKKSLDTNVYIYLTKNLSTDVMGNINSFLNFRVGEYLKKKILEQAQRVAGGLTNEFDNLVAYGADALRKTMPNLFPESIMNPNECNTTELLSQGYLWHNGKCSKLTPEEISKDADTMTPGNDGGSFPLDGQGGGYLNIDGEEQTRQMLCERAGYVWSQYNGGDSGKGQEGLKEGASTCAEDQWIGTDLKKLTDVKQWGKNALAGGINFIEEFSVALTATIMHTVMAYTDVWVEDEVLAPLENYISQFSGLQSSLKKFLHTSVNDLLPAQISQTLNSNVDKVLKDICAKAPPEPTDPGEWERLKGGTQTLHLSLYGEKTYGKEIDINGTVTSNENLWRVCDVSKHLHATLSGAISSTGALGKKIMDIFNSKVVDLIPWDGAKKYLAMSPAALIFEATGLKDIDKLVTASPVDLLCGRIVKVDGMKDDGSPKFGLSGITLEAKCNEIKIKRPISASGYSSDTITFPEVDMLKANAAGSGQFWRNYCPIIWGACVSPGDGSIPFLGKTVGEVAKSLLVMGCNLATEEADIKTCDIALKHSTAYTLMATAIESDIALAFRTEGQLQNEIEFYRWLRIYFPVWDTNGEIAKVAQSRGIAWAKVTASDAQDYVTLTKVNEMSADNWLRVLALWRLGAGPSTVKQMLVIIPDGIIKPAKNNDPTMLLPAGQGASINILGLKPSQLWKILLPTGASQVAAGGKNIDANFVCKKVKDYYAVKYPTLTFKAISDRITKSRPPALEYSMESLDRTTIAEVLNQLAEVNNDWSDAYLLCYYLEASPAQIFGLDQELMRYIQPKEYQLLFRLIEGELSPDERPDFLNKLLLFLNGQTPVSALEAVKTNIDKLVLPNEILANHWWYDGSVNTIAFSQANVTPHIDGIVRFLDRPLGNYLGAAQLGLQQDKDKNQPQERTIIDQLCAELKIENICNKKIANDVDWVEIQNLLLKTPADLMAAALPWQIPNPAGWDKGICKEKLSTNSCSARDEYIVPPGGKNTTGHTLCCKKVNSLMDAVGLYWPPLGQPYIDSLFNAAGWTDNMYNFLDETAVKWDNADEKYKKGRSAVAGAIDKVVLEEPKALISNVFSKVGNMAGIASGDDLGETMAGKCWEADSCDTTKGEVARVTPDGKKQCCDMGGALVCQNKCRLKGDVPCREKQGEFALSNEGKEKCCYAFSADNKAQECQKCRELIGKEAGGKCNREGEKLFEPKDSKIKLCCKERAVKTNFEGASLPEGIESDVAFATKACCETIDECVTGKFLDHLETMKNFLVDGLPINSLFPPKE